MVDWVLNTPQVFHKVKKGINKNKICICNCDQKSLNEKDTELNLCSIFSILTFNEFYLFA